MVGIAYAAGGVQVGSDDGDAGTCSCICDIAMAVCAIVNTSAIAGISTIL